VIAEERSVAEVRSQVGKIQALMEAVMQKDQHYGVIPGTSGKPSLLKPGAEKLCFVFRYAAEFSIERIDLPDDHREYIVGCTLKDTTGRIVAQGVGSCSSKEKKYRYRKNGDENPNIADVYNTVLKMAKKRSHVDATITACAASDIFTQDVEDMSFEESERNVPPPNPRQGQAEEERSAPPAPDPVREAIRSEIARFVRIMEASGESGPYFSDEDKTKGKAKLAVAKGATEANLAYVKTVVAEYEARLEAAMNPE
jgi:hypothetical protein